MLIKKIRLDKYLFDSGLVESRAKAQALILSGLVYVRGEKIDKPGHPIQADIELEIRNNHLGYVSRGGLKLESAIKYFDIRVGEKICGDIGASTGGFTDCLLQFGAKKVYAIDTGYGQFDYRLRQDQRVILMENSNARYLTETSIPEKIDLLAIDVSFISLKLILPAVMKLMQPLGEIISLIKPQFEAGRKFISKGGVLKDDFIRKKVLDDIILFSGQIGLNVIDIMESPLKKPKGNIEYFMYAGIKNCLIE